MPIWHHRTVLRAEGGVFEQQSSWLPAVRSELSEPSAPDCDWLPHQEYALFPPVIGVLTLKAPD
eukprot:8189422-Pyramimonas_sp.AAC.1